MVVIGTIFFVEFVEQTEVELIFLVIVLYVGGQLVSTGVMTVGFVQLVTLCEVVFGQLFLCEHVVPVVITVLVDHLVTSTVRGGGWQTVVSCGQTDVVTFLLVRPGHLTQGSVSVTDFVMCSVMILGVGHWVIEADLLDKPLLEVTLLLELVLRPGAIDVLLRKFVELEDLLCIEELEVAIGPG